MGNVSGCAFTHWSHYTSCRHDRRYLMRCAIETETDLIRVLTICAGEQERTTPMIANNTEEPLEGQDIPPQSEPRSLIAKPTPGPWKYQEDSDAYTHIVRAPGVFLCQLRQVTDGSAEADARLIAAAPDLLAACQDQLRWLALNIPFDEVSVELADAMDAQREKLRAVIEKATAPPPAPPLP